MSDVEQGIVIAGIVVAIFYISIFYFVYWINKQGKKKNERKN